MSIKVLLIDDEPMMKRMLAEVFRPPEFEFLAAPDGREGLRLAYDFRPDVILLDIMMPGMSGWEVCQRIREFSPVPIIMLTAMGQTTDKVRGLDMGADDYITKPVDLEEVRARVKALLRRAAVGEQTACLYSIGGDYLTIDPIARRVRVAGHEISLTPTEYNLLLYFVTHPDRPLSYGELLDNVWGPGYEGAVSNLKLYILYLRRKIEPDPENPIYIVNERGVGYRFVRSPLQEK
ncbi:MAG: response regulator transcription factor [Chloroflexi bacterium]|nr:response regulator transcription factor [Chloroflexota bacterium]